jgi:hypothetical protein
MKKMVLRLLLPMVLVAGFAAPAAPQIADGYGYDLQIYYLYVPSDWDELGASGSSAKVYYCSAKGSWGGSCADCVTTSKGTKVCGNVYVSASCQCDSNCSVTGSCSYQQ